ncbi:hypothetical protein J4227_05600 [Candidatus Woesearchaeota archaeon]|nr:hypothetical protein [Candidatus Woesearchaeota archaeon]
MKPKQQITQHVQIVAIAFIILMGILYYSYLHKLGYLKIATYTFFILAGLTSVYNAFTWKTARGRAFWAIVSAALIYALADKYNKLHMILAFGIMPMIDGISLGDAKILVNIIYVTGFAFVMLFFASFIYSEYKAESDWLYLFVLAFAVKAGSIINDIVFHHGLAEDYMESFSLFFFTSAAIIAAFKNHNEKNPKVNHENRNIPSPNQ